MKCNYIFSLSVYTFVSLFIMLLNTTVSYNINDEENSEYIAKDYMFHTNLIRNNRDDIIGIMCTQKV